MWEGMEESCVVESEKYDLPFVSGGELISADFSSVAFICYPHSPQWLSVFKSYFWYKLIWPRQQGIWEAQRTIHSIPTRYSGLSPSCLPPYFLFSLLLLCLPLLLTRDQPWPPALEARSLNHWTRTSLLLFLLKEKLVKVSLFVVVVPRALEIRHLLRKEGKVGSLLFYFFPFLFIFEAHMLPLIVIEAEFSMEASQPASEPPGLGSSAPLSQTALGDLDRPHAVRYMVSGAGLILQNRQERGLFLK